MKILVVCVAVLFAGLQADGRRLPDRWRPEYPGGINRPRPSPTFPERPKLRYVREVEEETPLTVPEDAETPEVREKRSPLRSRQPSDSTIFKPDFPPKPSPTIPEYPQTFRHVRDVAEVSEDDETETREKRSPKERGSWDVSVNKDKGRGPQVHSQAKGNVYTSPNGNWKVDAHGNHEFGKGRKPSYGAGVSVSGRFRRDVVDEEEDESRQKRSFAPGTSSNPSAGSSRGQQSDRGSWGVSVNKDNGRGPQVRTEGQGNVYTGKDGRVKVDAHGHHEFGKGRKPSYGGGVSGRWRRDLDEVEEEDEESTRVRREANPQNRGSIGVSLDHQHGRGPMVRTDANYNLYRSHNGNWNLGANAFHEAGRGMKPNYGGGLTLTGRFRRSAEEEIDE